MSSYARFLMYWLSLCRSYDGFWQYDSFPNADQPALGGPQQRPGPFTSFGVRPTSGQRIPGTHQSGIGRPQVGGLQPAVRQPQSNVGSWPHGQNTPDRPSVDMTVDGQPQSNVGSWPHGQNNRGRPPVDTTVNGQPQSNVGSWPHGQNTPARLSVDTTIGEQPQSNVGSWPHGQNNRGRPSVDRTFGGRHRPATSGTSQTGGQPNDVANLARNMGLNQFANWISNTGLLEKIHDGGVYTVFAPTDDAVNSLPQDMVQSIDSNPEQVKSIMQYHIVPKRINLNSVTNEETVSTLLQGKTIRFNVYQNSPSCNCKQLVTASGTPVGESLATMGSIQVIPVGQVLYQPTGNMLKIVEASPILQKLNEAVKSARMTWLLSGSSPLTFFAPSDAAFNSLTEEQTKTLVEDKQAFSNLLKRHLVRGTFFSNGVQEDIEKKSENNTPIKLSLQEGILTVNSIPVIYADITATNGVLHVIDEFL